MPQSDHVLERRAHMLAGRLVARRDVIRNAITAPGGRPPFTQQLSKPDALRFWQLHRYDQIGAQVLAKMQPTDVMELDQALSQANAQEIMGGQAGSGGSL